MRTLTKREFEVIQLYTRGLTFKEIGNCLNIATRTAINYYMRVKTKDKSRLTRAKKSRAIHKHSYAIRLKEVIQDVREYNKEIKRNRHIFRSELSIKNQSKMLRLNYFDECLLFTSKNYHRFRLKSVKLLR